MESDDNLNLLADQILARLNQLARERSLPPISSSSQHLFSSGQYDSLFAIRVVLLLEGEFKMPETEQIQHVNDIDTVLMMAQLVLTHRP